MKWINRFLYILVDRLQSRIVPNALEAAAWTGAPGAYTDRPSPEHLYPDAESQVSRADLMWCRHHLQLDRPIYVIPLGWRPFGYVPKRKIEAELWPWLENGCRRSYVTWVWFLKGDGNVGRDEELGFRRDTGRFVEDVPDRLELIPPNTDPMDIELAAPAIHMAVAAFASYTATVGMAMFCAHESRGDRNGNHDLAGNNDQHEWLIPQQLGYQRVPLNIDQPIPQ